MRPRQLTLYKSVITEPAQEIWQRIAPVQQKAVIRLYARLVARAAKHRSDDDAGPETREA